jgi:hypothetical protein
MKGNPRYSLGSLPKGRRILGTLKINTDGVAKSQKVGISVIPAKAGIQGFP